MRVVAILLFICFAAFAHSKPQDISSIKIITFDVYGALMDLSTSLEQNIKSILKSTLWEYQITQFTQGWMSKYNSLKDLNSLIRNPKVNLADEDLFRLMLRTTMNATLRQQGLSISSDLQDKLLTSWENLIPWDPTAATLSKLRNLTNSDGSPKFKLAILSNGDLDGLTKAASVFNQAPFFFTFDYILSSTKARMFKPDPIFYQQVEGCGFDASEVLHVAGAGFDALGAKVYGYSVVWNNVQGETFINLTGEDEYEPDYEISGLDQLLEIVG